MLTTLTPAQIATYRTGGFLVIEGFLTPAELAAWRAAVDEAVAARNARRPQTAPPSREQQYYDNVFVQRINLWQDHAGVRALMFDPRLGRMAAELAGVAGIRIWHDQALIKPPWGNPTAWHLDDPYWSFDSRDAISLWVALDDATLSNGCLYYLPGTHRSARFDNVGIGENTGALFAVYPEWSAIEAVPAPVRAGSCVWHNGLVAHAAGANMTPRPRRAMTCAYMPDGCTFNGKRNILTDEQLARLRVGDPLRDERQNPLVYADGAPARAPA